MTPPSEKIRIDKWLWQARFFKTRSLSSKLVSGGHLRL
ncbi:MAG: S4 domain-containing protein, partial [Phaeobacter italicus]